jgi:hypothetical protein
MNIAIMQPYFFPYIGYFQLIYSSDVFVIYDDVNFIKGGWINRNRILLNGDISYINVPMIGASSFKKINEIHVVDDREKLISKINQAYKKAPFYNEIYPFIEDVLNYDSDNLAEFLSNIILKLTGFLGINARILISSSIEKDKNLKGQAKVIDICKKLNASNYINSIGGMQLYNSNDFDNEGLNLKFLKTNDFTYNQFVNEFVPNLSILDFLMNKGVEEVKLKLKEYTLI